MINTSITVNIYIPSISSVPSVSTSLVKFEIWPVICEIPEPSHDMLLRRVVQCGAYLWLMCVRQGYFDEEMLQTGAESYRCIPSHEDCQLDGRHFDNQCGHAHKGSKESTCQRAPPAYDDLIQKVIAQIISRCHSIPHTKWASHLQLLEENIGQRHES